MQYMVRRLQRQGAGPRFRELAPLYVIGRPWWVAVTGFETPLPPFSRGGIVLPLSERGSKGV
jgi:hypothetical protein